MIPAINPTLLAIGATPAASILFKVTVATALALAGAWLARGSRAALRHALLAAAFGMLLLLPFASLIAPPVLIAVRTAPDRILRALPAGARSVRSITSARLAPGTEEAPPSTGLSLSTLLFAAWIAGAAIVLVPVATGLWQLRRIRRSALPWRHGQAVADALAADAGIRRPVAVLLHEALPGPMTCGALHPAIVLSRDAEGWAADDLKRALVHELEHVRRGDWPIHCLARAICAMYWFHPLVWVAWRRLVLEEERSCDDAVLQRSDPAAYADQLVGLARRLSMAAKTPALAMANRADLAARVGAVLDQRRRRGRAGTLPVAFACAAAALFVAGLSPLKMVAAPQTNDAATPHVRFRASSLLVIVDVAVTDANGNPIEGLNAGDFVLTEDGVPQPISILEFQKLSSPTPPLSSYYLMGYYTPNSRMDGAFRKVKVTLKNDSSAKLDFRAGYFSGRNVPAPEPPAPAAGAAPLDGAIPPVLLRKVEPAYSEEARKAKYQGNALLLVDVDTSGNATNTRMVRSLGLGLDEKAIEAVSSWKFRPAMKNGSAIPITVQVEVDFRLL
jgi:TonB family protein